MRAAGGRRRKAVGRLLLSLTVVDVETDGGRGRGECDDGTPEMGLSLASVDSEKVEKRT